MTLSPITSKLYSGLFSSLEIAALFSDESHIKHLLEVEAALARAQGKLEIIPLAAAARISSTTQDLQVDLEQLRVGIENDGFPVIELVRQLREHVGADAASFVHFGATTQDIMDTALVLQTRAALTILERDLKRVIGNFSSLANLHRNTLMAGRTHSQQALPITFGLKVCTWLAPLLRHLERLSELKPRVLILQFGGAAGTLASLSSRGLEVQTELARELELHNPIMPWHSQRDSWAELANWLSLVTGNLGKMAQDILLLAQSEIAEVRESNDTSRGGSSTMPQKSNPIVSELIVAAARTNSSLLSNMHHALISEHERGTSGWQMEMLSLGQMIALTAGALEKSIFLSENLVINTKQMLENVKKSNGLMLAEALQFALGQHMPRSDAKKLVQQAVKIELEENRNLIEVARELTQAPVEWQHLTESQYLGSSQDFIDRVLEKAEKILEI